MMDNPAFTSYGNPIDSKPIATKTGGNNEPEHTGLDLKRKIGFFRGTAFVIGVVIGTGIFISPGRVLAKTGSVGLCLIVWSIGGVLSSLGALAYAELGTLIPKSGGNYAYFLTCFGEMHPFWGPLPAFLSMFINVFFTRAASQAIASYSLASYVLTPFFEGFGICVDSEDVAMAIKLVAFLSLGLVTFINCYSVSLAAKVQVVFTVAKLSAIATIIGGGFYKIGTGSTQYLSQGMNETTDSIGSVAEAFYACLYAYGGWENITLITEEIRDPAKNLPKSILSGIAFVTFCYILVNIAFLSVLTPAEIIGSKAVATDWSNYVLGSASVLVPFVVAMSIFGSHNGSSFTGARLCYAGGREGQFPRILSYIDIDRRTPKPSVLLNAVLASIMILIGNVSSLINIFSFTSWIFNGVAMVALLIMKRRSAHVKVFFRTPIIVPITVLVIAIFLVIMPIATDPKVEFLYSCLAFFVGFLYYVVFVYYRKTLPLLDSIGNFTYMIDSILEKVLNVAPPKKVDD